MKNREDSIAEVSHDYNNHINFWWHFWVSKDGMHGNTNLRNYERGYKRPHNLKDQSNESAFFLNHGQGCQFEIEEIEVFVVRDAVEGF